ncbi:uncharacterized protein LOC144202179 [Stigmatopora nigra]
MKCTLNVDEFLPGATPQPSILMSILKERTCSPYAFAQLKQKKKVTLEMTFQRFSWRMDRGFCLAVAVLTVLATFPTVRGTEHLSFDNSVEANVTRVGCNEDVLCLETPEDCNPVDNQTCSFVSLDASSSLPEFNLTVRLSGDFSVNSTGIAFGLTQNFSAANTMLYVCGRNSSGDFFFGTVTRLPNNTLEPNERNTTQIRSRLNENNTQCEFILPNVDTRIMNEMMDGNTAFVILGRVNLTTDNNTVENFTEIIEFMRVNLTDANGTIVEPLSVTRVGCNEEILCLETPEDCNPVNNQTCLFASLDASSSLPEFNLTVRLSGNFSDNSRGIALGLTQNFMKENTVLYVCGRNSTGGFFFKTMTRFPNNTVVSNDMNAVLARYVLGENISQCEFTIVNVDTRNKGEMRDGNTAIVVLGTVVVNDSTVESFTDELMGGRVNLTNAAGTISPKDINNADCRNTKLCIETPTDCDPQTNNCLFSSLQTTVANEIFNITVELDGDSNGSSYIALGLTQSGMEDSTYIYLCGRNGSAFVFQTLVRNNSNGGSLRQIDQEVMDVCSFVNDVSIQCTFTIVNLNTSMMTRESSPMFRVEVGDGAIEGGEIGNFNSRVDSGPLDITDAMADAPAPGFIAAELNITRDGCNDTNLCVDQPDNCDPSEQNMCQFMSSNTSIGANGAFNMSVRLSGYTEGFFALGLAANASMGTSTIYLCGNSNNGTLIFLTYRRNNTNNTFEIIAPESNVTLDVGGNKSVECEFNIFNLNGATTRQTDGVIADIILANGTVNSTTGLPETFNIVLTARANLTSPNGTIMNAAWTGKSSNVMMLFLSVIVLLAVLQG